MREEDKDEVRRIWREEEAKRRRRDEEMKRRWREEKAKRRHRDEELKRRRLDKSGRPQSGLVDTDETVYED